MALPSKLPSNHLPVLLESMPATDISADGTPWYSTNRSGPCASGLLPPGFVTVTMVIGLPSWSSIAIPPSWMPSYGPVRTSVNRKR